MNQLISRILLIKDKMKEIEKKSMNYFRNSSQNKEFHFHTHMDTKLQILKKDKEKTFNSYF